LKLRGGRGVPKRWQNAVLNPSICRDSGKWVVIFCTFEFGAKNAVWGLWMGQWVVNGWPNSGKKREVKYRIMPFFLPVNTHLMSKIDNYKYIILSNIQIVS
jgi:hypothetical protein